MPDYPARLFRGVSDDVFRMVRVDPATVEVPLSHEFTARRILAPKVSGVPFASEAQAGQEYAVCGSGVVCGASPTNSVVRHQWRQAGLPTSGISATPHFERARHYALAGGRCEAGRVLEFDLERLLRLRVRLFVVNAVVPHPAIPEDDEHVLVAEDFGPIPPSTVVRVHFVTSGE